MLSHRLGHFVFFSSFTLPISNFTGCQYNWQTHGNNKIQRTLRWSVTKEKETRWEEKANQLIVIEIVLRFSFSHVFSLFLLKRNEVLSEFLVDFTLLFTLPFRHDDTVNKYIRLNSRFNWFLIIFWFRKFYSWIDSIHLSDRKWHWLQFCVFFFFLSSLLPFSFILFLNSDM